MISQVTGAICVYSRGSGGVCMSEGGWSIGSGKEMNALKLNPYAAGG